MIKVPTDLSTLKELLVNSIKSSRLSVRNTLLEKSCIFCTGKTLEQDSICGPCMLDLPWNTAFCKVCAVPLAEPTGGNFICGACLAKPPCFDHCHSAFRYEFPLRFAIHQLKYQQQRYWAKPLSACLHRALNEVLEESGPPDALLAVPMDKKKLRQRSYNQSALLAHSLGKKLNIAIDSHSLIKCRATASQSSLDKNERRRNLKDSFVLTRPVSYRQVAIVDDVMTTGATADILAQLLKKQGVQKVSVWCVARTPAPAMI